MQCYFMKFTILLHEKQPFFSEKNPNTDLAAESLMSRNGQDVSFMPHQKDRYIYFTISPILFMIVAITNNVVEIQYLLDLYVLLDLAPRVTALCHIYFSSSSFYLVFNSVYSSGAQSVTLQYAVFPFKETELMCKDHIQNPPKINIYDILLIKKAGFHSLLSVHVTTQTAQFR